MYVNSLSFKTNLETIITFSRAKEFTTRSKMHFSLKTLGEKKKKGVKSLALF